VLAAALVLLVDAVVGLPCSVEAMVKSGAMPAHDVGPWRWPGVAPLARVPFSGSATGMRADRRTGRPSARGDVALVAWAIAWVVLGSAIGWQLWRLGDVGAALVESGEALDEAGAALEAIGSVPIVGDRPGELGTEVRDAAAEVRDSGSTARSSLRWLAPLVGAAVALAPTAPVLVVHVPRRRRLAQEAQAVRRAMPGGVPAPGLEDALARRALVNVPLDDLLGIGAGPLADATSGDLEARRRRVLANAELTRLGLAKPGGLAGAPPAAGRPVG
jgi:hypothetical protein